MPTPWEPESWEGFRQAYKAGDCRVVLFKRTRAWAKENGWKPGWFGFEARFVRRLVEDENAFREAYSANVFLLYQRTPRSLEAALRG